MKLLHLLTTVLALLFSSIFAYSQPSFQWADKLNCNNTVNMVGAIKQDNNGNVYVLSMFRGTIVFPNGVLADNSSTSPGLYGAVLAKYNAQGTVLWGVQVCTVEQNYLAMDIDSSGNIYVGVLEDVSDVLVAKYDSAGNQLWNNTSFQGTFGIYSLVIKLNAPQTDLLLVFGITGRGQMELGNNIEIALGTADLPSNAIASYDISSGLATYGNLIATNVAPVNGIAVADDNSVYIYNDTSFLKVDYLGDVIWTKSPMENSTTNVTNVSGIATDGKDCFVIGNFAGGTVQLDGLAATTNYTSDFFTAKVTSAGTTDFIHAGCSGASGTAIGEQIAFDKNQSFYISGYSNAQSVGNPPRAIQSPNEHFILRYDTAGNDLWMVPFNTNLNTNPVTLIPNRAAITISDSLNIFASGVYKPTAHFGYDDSLINNFSSRDAFVFKVSQCNLSQATVTPSGPVSICQGQTVTLTCSQAPNYSWSNNQTTEAITVSASGTYAVTVSNNLGCSTNSLPISVTVNPTPAIPTINVAGNVLASSSATGNQWLLNGTIISGASNQIFTVGAITDTACYSVIVTDSFGCSATSDSVCFSPVATTGIDNLAIISLCISPNPVDNYVYVKMDISGNYEFDLLNSIGQLIDTRDAFQMVVFNTERLASGLYFIQAIDKNSLNKIVRQKLIVQH
jgi:hypothetical protein